MEKRTKIYMGRLIDADELRDAILAVASRMKETHKENFMNFMEHTYCFTINQVVGLLDASPTAYSVDKVVAELVEEANTARMFGSIGAASAFGRAIKIVKKEGGIE